MSKKSTRKFKTEVQELLDLIIHSLYSHKEIFLRELISNASDAIDRLRYRAQTEPALLEGGSAEFEIRLTPDAAARTLEVADNGIGMTFDEVVENIGTIARSGTAEFAAALRESREKASLAPELIGRFGVGFYSAFMVAEKITLTTRAAGSEKGVRWESAGDGSYTVEETEVAERGTRILLHLRPREEGEPDWTDPWTLRGIVKRHSDFVSYPVTMEVTRKVPVEGEEGKLEEKRETDVLNSMKAIWARPKNEITEEEYNEFYKHVSHDWTEPLTRLHVRLEGTAEFDALLYVPSRRPVDLYWAERKHGVQLYSRRVFITDQMKDLLPEYLRFLRGVVDSADINLNVSREILQEDRTLRTVRRALAKKVLEHLATLDTQTYDAFYAEFGTVLKEGVYGDPDNRDRIAKLLRYATTRSEGKLVPLDEIVARTPEAQAHLYYLTGDSLAALSDNPHLEALKARGVEVILMADPVDEFVVEALSEYSGKTLKSAEKGDLDLPEGAEAKERQEAYGGLIGFLKEVLADRVSDVRPSARLTDSAACLSSDERQMSALMIRMLRASGQKVADVKRVLEINLDHPLTAALKKRQEAHPADPALAEDARLLYDLALLSEGARVENPAAFAKKLGELAAKALEEKGETSG